MILMEIIAPRGSMKLENFPTIEEFRESKFAPLFYKGIRWEKLLGDKKLDLYSKARKRFINRQCRGIKFFVRQHRYQGKNGHNRKAV